MRTERTGWTQVVGRIPGNLAKVIRLVFGGNGAQLGYELRNKWKGVDLEFVSVEDLGLPPERAHFHSSSGGPALAEVFRSIEIPVGSVALDLGSGKGGAALTLSRLGFAEVIGVELSAPLIEIARRNAACLGRTNISFLHGDATHFADYDRVTHVYMYNPFPCSVMKKVVGHLGASLRRVPRGVTIVYRNPVCHDTIIASNLFEARAEQHRDGHAWRVYQSLER